MRSRSDGPEPARLVAVRRRFELWRRTRRGRARIPERLWKSAVRLAATNGLCRTARALGLDYNALKQRVESAGLNKSVPELERRRKMPIQVGSAARKLRSTTHIAKPPGRAPAMTFVELPPLAGSGSSECFVELEDPRGAKMRIRLADYQSREVVTALSRVFLGIQP